MKARSRMTLAWTPDMATEDRRKLQGILENIFHLPCYCAEESLARFLVRSMYRLPPNVVFARCARPVSPVVLRILGRLFTVWVVDGDLRVNQFRGSVTFHLRRAVTLAWSTTPTATTRWPEEDLLQHRWGLPVRWHSGPVLGLLRTVAAIRPARIVLVDPRDVPRWSIKLLAIATNVTVYNEFGQSFDIDRAHESIVRQYFALSRHGHHSRRGKWLLSSWLIIHAGSRYAVGSI